MNPWDAPRPRGAVGAARALAHRARVRVRDLRHNLRAGRPERRIVVLRQWHNNWNYNDHFLAWVHARVPEAAPLFSLHRAPGRMPALDCCALLVPWLQDPLRERFPDVFAWVRRVEDACAARAIPIVNPVAHLSHAVKSVAAGLIAATGIRTARMVPIADPAAFRRDQGGLTPPFFVRENVRHGSVMVMIDDLADLDRVPWAGFEAPVAVEFVDVRGPDGLYRRYRYVAIGERGIARSLRTTATWRSTREARIFDDATCAEEVRYLTRPDPNHARLQRARVALGLDTVAFDYGYAAGGELVVFEPNPLPNLWDPTGGPRYQAYQVPLFDLIYGELLRYYLRRAGRARPALSALPAVPVLGASDAGSRHAAAPRNTSTR